MKKILVYSHDTFGLGNIRRMLSIAEHLVHADPENMVLVISGSTALPAFTLSDRIDYIKLPCLSRTVDGDYQARSLRLPFEELIELRANLILNAVLGFKPDLILVDKKPFGVGNELFHVLDLLGRRTLCPRMVLLLRDVLDAPESTRALWKKNDYHDAIRQYYDRVLVVGQRQVFDMARAYCFPKSTRTRLRYCGYIRKPSDAVEDVGSSSISNEQRILVTPGGGEDGMHLVETFVATVSSNPIRNTKIHLVLGPEFKKDLRTKILGAISKNPNITWEDFTTRMDERMRHADLIISMAGYNTTYEALSHGKKLLLVPRTRPGEEQIIRAEQLHRLGLVRWIHPDRLTPELFRAAIVEALDDPYSDGLSPLLSFNGLEKVHSFVDELLERPAFPQLVRAMA